MKNAIKKCNAFLLYLIMSSSVPSLSLSLFQTTRGETCSAPSYRQERTSANKLIVIPESNHSKYMCLDWYHDSLQHKDPIFLVWICASFVYEINQQTHSRAPSYSEKKLRFHKWKLQRDKAKEIVRYARHSGDASIITPFALVISD